MAFSLKLQKAIYDKLSADLSVPVYDCPQQNDAYPYVNVGDDIFTEDGTNTTNGMLVISTIHVWDNFRGYSRIKGIIDQVYSSLNRVNFAIQDLHLIDCIFDSSDFFLDSDGKTRHGIITFKILLDEE